MADLIEIYKLQKMITALQASRVAKHIENLISSAMKNAKPQPISQSMQVQYVRIKGTFATQETDHRCQNKALPMRHPP